MRTTSKDSNARSVTEVHHQRRKANSRSSSKMVCINKDDAANVEKSRGFTSTLTYKRRKVSAKRDFPPNCKRNAPLISRSLPQDGADGEFSDGSRQNAPQRKNRGTVSAVREFPKGCGRNALSMDTISENKAAVSGDKTSEVGQYFECSESISIKQSGHSMELVSFELTERPDQLGLSQALTPESTDALNVLHQLDIPKPIEALEPNVMNSQRSSVKSNLTSHSKEHEFTRLLRNSEVPNTEHFLKSASHPVGINLPCSLVQLPVDSVMPEVQLQCNVSDQAQASDCGEAVENSLHKKYSPCRRSTVYRDLPLCLQSRSPCSIVEVNSFRNIDVDNEMASGKNIGDRKVRSDEMQSNLKINNEHCVGSGQQGHSVMKKAIVDDTEGKLLAAAGEQVKICESNFNQKIMDETNIDVPYVNLRSQSDINFTSNEFVDREIKVSEKNLRKESLQMNGNICSKRNVLEKHVYESCTMGNVERECYKRIVVLALMAVPNCLGSNGKCDSRSQKNPRDATTESKRKKHADKNFPVSHSQKNPRDARTESKRKKHADENCPVSHSQAKEHVGLDESKKKVVVLALRAEPQNLGKQTSISPSGLTHGITDMLDRLIHDKPSSNFEEENPLVEKSECTQKKLFLTGYDGEDDNGSVQTSRKKDLSLIPFGLNPLVDECDDNGIDVIPSDVNASLQAVHISQKMDLSVIPYGLHQLGYKDNSNEAGVTRHMVRETLRVFHGIVRKLIQDTESKSKDVQSNSSGRADLISANILKEKQKWVNTGKQILGTVPGVEVGDEFRFRVELAIIGLHRPFQSGIDYLKKNEKIVATSIVASGGYNDVIGNSDVLVYSGQGGIPTSGEKKAEDQKLVRGNLALKNSIDEGTPVRVIRGFKETNDFPDSRGKVVATYTYDGLYLVEKFWQEKGLYGTNVFKYQLRRIPGQPELPIREVKKSKKGRVRDGLCALDISQGKETMPICAINKVNADKPPPFKYITHIMYPSWYAPLPPEGCGCSDGCSDSETCLCAVKNGGEIPYNHNGAIVEAKTLVYECGPSCKCPSTCHNRVSQHGIKFQLEIFKTESRGWGVRSLNSIPSGSFICEYTGELLQEKEAEQRTGNDEYLFDIGHNYQDHAVSEGVTNMMQLDLKSNLLSEAMEVEEEEGFTIDAALYGSVGRFINHSCSPNLYAQNVLYDHNDKRMPHIMLFAAENIPPLQELTYHYNYEPGQVRDSDGNIKRKDCYCGSMECSGRLY